MALDKNAIKGIGLLAFVGVLFGSGYFVAKPQIEEAFSLMDETKTVNEATEMRELRLIKLKNESENIDALKTEVNELLKRIPSDKNVTDIAGAVIKALPPGVQLTKFSHGEMVEGGPSYTEPKASLVAGEPPFVLVVPGEGAAGAGASKSKTDEEKSAAPVEDKSKPKAVPAFATAPFILEVTASGTESLANYLDMLQYQDRLITIVSVTSSSTDGGETKATIYGYAFAGSNDQIKAWENPPADEEE